MGAQCAFGQAVSRGHAMKPERPNTATRYPVYADEAIRLIESGVLRPGDRR